MAMHNMSPFANRQLLNPICHLLLPPSEDLSQSTNLHAPQKQKIKSCKAEARWTHCLCKACYKSIKPRSLGLFCPGSDPDAALTTEPKPESTDESEAGDRLIAPVEELHHLFSVFLSLHLQLKEKPVTDVWGLDSKMGFLAPTGC